MSQEAQKIRVREEASYSDRDPQEVGNPAYESSELSSRKGYRAVGGGCRGDPHLQSFPPLLGEGPQVVPLVTDFLAPGVDTG